MTKCTLTLIMALFVSLVSAQTEIKINPIGAIFGSPDVSVEFAAGEHIGIEPFVGLSWGKLTVLDEEFKSNGFGYGAGAKYYFSPKRGIDRFYAGLYLRGGSSKFTNTVGTADESFRRNRMGAGLSLGYKIASSKGVVFEISAGLGRKIFNKYSDASGSVNTANVPVLNLDGFFKLAVGYRFGGGNKS